MTDRLISCDDHMDLSQLPADLWTTRLPASLLGRSMSWARGGTLASLCQQHNSA